MTIERRIRITTGVLIIFATGAGLVLFLTSRQVGDGIRRIETTSKIVHSTFMLRVLMDEYLARGGKSTLRQWERHRVLLGRILDEMPAEGVDTALLSDIRGSYRGVNALAPQIIRMWSSQEADHNSQDLRMTDMLARLMLLRMEQLANAANDLSATTQSLTLQRRFVVQKLIVAFGIATVVIILINIHLIRKSIIQPLKLLSNGAERIGAGNFDHITEIKSDDEVGKLTQAFNKMIQRLKERNSALKKASDELELKVEKRTAELRTVNAYNRSLLEASLDPLVTISPEGKITDVNMATENVTGFSRSDLIGTDFADYFTDLEKARSGYQQVFRDGSVKDYELAIRHKNGRVTPVTYNASLYRDEQGKVVGIFAAARDISDRKLAEEDLIRSNQDLQQFAYVASHDLQEPLRNVAGCLQLLEKKYKNRLDSDADQYIFYAVESSVRMKALIQDLLAYSRVGTRGKPSEPTDCELILGETLKNLSSAIAETGAEITHDPLPTVFADETQLLQVFQNLVGNALKFRKECPPQVHISAVKNKNDWVFSVKDNGIGIETRHLDRIFAIFQRLHKRSKYDGTGMGLAIVKKVVERHRGQIWVESELGVGTTFYFSIPEKRAKT